VTSFKVGAAPCAHRPDVGSLLVAVFGMTAFTLSSARTARSHRRPSARPARPGSAAWLTIACAHRPGARDRNARRPLSSSDCRAAGDCIGDYGIGVRPEIGWHARRSCHLAGVTLVIAESAGPERSARADPTDQVLRSVSGRPSSHWLRGDGESLLGGVVVIREREVDLCTAGVVQRQIYAVGCPPNPSGSPCVPEMGTQHGRVLWDVHSVLNHVHVERGGAHCGAATKDGLRHHAASRVMCPFGPAGVPWAIVSWGCRSLFAVVLDGCPREV
jgi:hypothetical protein